MKFLIDHQLPPVLCDFLRGQGCDAERVHGIGMASSTDIEICRYASANDRIIVSKDEDFFYLSRRADFDFRLLWIRLGNCRTQRLLSALEQQWIKIAECLESGDRVVEIR